MSIRRVISVIVLNEHGVLSRIAGLFAGRGYNIDSLTVAPIPESEFSRLSIVTSGDERVLEQIVKQLHKLIPTYKVIESGEFVEKEMALVKIPLNESFAGLDAILKYQRKLHRGNGRRRHCADRRIFKNDKKIQPDRYRSRRVGFNGYLR